jgi:hypothetical protein
MGMGTVSEMSLYLLSLCTILTRFGELYLRATQMVAVLTVRCCSSIVVPTIGTSRALLGAAGIEWRVIIGVGGGV